MLKRKITNKIINNQISFESYGVKIGVRSNLPVYIENVIERLNIILPDQFEFIENKESRILIDLRIGEDRIFEIYAGGQRIIRTGIEEEFKSLLESHIRLTAAEYATEKVFLHAGVVGWKGQAVVLPGSSFAGKTTLVAELIKCGAEYYSDEYAVLDQSGWVHPFPKMLSLRGIVDDFKQVDCSAESMGAGVGVEPLEIALILLCRFDKSFAGNLETELEILSPGAGILKILPHAISIRYNPQFVFKVLNKVATRAIIAETQRGEAKIFARHLIEYLNGYV